MARIGIAIDLGTSGFRGQALSLDGDCAILSTAITSRHPLPGANVMDHLHVALELGVDWAQETVIHAVNRIIGSLRINPDEVARVAICGNPIQLSIFQNMEIRDLAYAGKRKLNALGVVPAKRDARIFKACDVRDLGLPARTDILVPPAVRHEIGADALAMIVQTGVLERNETSIVTDYGTNAEMALIAGGTVYTGSTAAGPAIEGQQIRDGILALPGAICDVEILGNCGCSSVKRHPGPCAGESCRKALACRVLDRIMVPVPGDTVDPCTGECILKGEAKALGITGTGVVSLIKECLTHGLIRLPRIHAPEKTIRLANGVRFLETDLSEAGKAIGAIRAGHITLAHEAGIRMGDIESAYMSGASGTYVDALKARSVGMIPGGVSRIYQVGNTSLAMARDLVRDVEELWRMQRIADDLRQHHCMFAESRTFERVYVLELSYWTEGMSMDLYQKFLQKYRLPSLPEKMEPPEVIRTNQKDIQEQGVLGLQIISDIGETKTMVFDACVGDGGCIESCPERALRLKRTEKGAFAITVDLSLCNGVACRRCENVCKEGAFNLIELLRS